MTSLIAIDGHSLNLGLQKIAKARKSNDRFRIDYELLAHFLLESVTYPDATLNFYTDNQKLDNITPERSLGRITKYFSDKGYGFISTTDGGSYFFHNNDITNKRVLCNTDESRYPHPTSDEFRKRVLNKIVSYTPTLGEDGRTKAEDIKLEFSSKTIDRFYSLRREPFLEMLSESGFNVIRCRPSQVPGKSKGIDIKITIDAMAGLSNEDNLILLTDDPIYCDLIYALEDYDISTTLITFKTSRSQELIEAASKSGMVLFLEDNLENLELQYEDEDEDDHSDEQEALVSDKVLTS